MHSVLPLNGSSTDVLAIANTPVLWICALGVFGVVVVQSLIYMRAARRVAPAVGMTPDELRVSFRSGAVAAIGPSLAVVLVAIALLALFGTPAVLVRIGLIGSAAYETGAANVAAATVGAELGGAMWMLATLVFTPLLKRGGHRLATVNPLVMTIVPASALLAAFISLGLAEAPKSTAHALTLLAAAAAMGACLLLARILHRPWLREWGLGIAIVAGLLAAYTAHTAGLGPA
ncbi:DUF5058 family protein [Arthrobacter koreensis]|uniref:DUF5058 family protein n=1 Tax=Arthrobacter koreensis TaxID=199136 RepID=UPI002DBB419E|nr:DUF5058 family protein [Arthrobacter koreensis]MEB7447892.1 DUF5058 family protein [Arthrobacter koreensis]